MRFLAKRLLAFVLLAIGLTSGAHAQLCVHGQVTTNVWTGVSSNFLNDYRNLGDAYACQTQPVFTQTVTSSQRYDIFPSDPLLLRQSADASLFAYAAFGGLRATVSGQTAIGNSIQNITSAGGSLSETWNDVITFHTASPLGADFNFSITLDDGLGTNLPIGAGYAANSSAVANASTAFFLNGGGTPLLSVFDSQSLYVDHFGAVSPAATSDHPGARTVSTLLHMYDGQTFNIAQTLQVQAGANGFGSAYADAGDTAFFNLSSTDPLAGYTTASGTVFLAAGDPFAVSPVPEPSEWALMTMGFGVLGLFRRRLTKR